MADNDLPLFEGAGKFYVYIYRDPRPPKKLVIIYVGKGTAKHKRADIHWDYGACNPMLRAILKKCRDADLEPIRRIVFWTDDEASAFDYERALIKKFGRRDLKLGSLCNLTDGGDGASGFTHSADARSRMGAARCGEKNPNFGKKHSPEARAKMSVGQHGRHRSPEERAKISSARRGWRCSPEVCAKMSAARLGTHRSPETRAKMSAAGLAFWTRE